MSGHDPMCQTRTTLTFASWLLCDCPRVHAIRADERERWIQWAAKNACCEAGLVAAPDPCPWHPDGLRAQVMALGTLGSGWSDNSPVVLLSDVLALFGDDETHRRDATGG